MSKFTPFDLKPYFNAGREPHGWHPQIARCLQTLPAGAVTFWGVPFELAPAEGNCWLVLDRDHPSVTLPLAGDASFILIAHFCDESHDPEAKNQPSDYEVGFITRPGEVLAEYHLVYSDATEYARPVRRRFEISELVTMWGQEAFASRPHEEDLPRDWRGPYPAAQWGLYQTGVGRSVDSSEPVGMYWLYALANPYPDRQLASIRLESSGRGRLAVAGVTLYDGLENPLRHRRLESFRVTSSEPVQPRDAEIAVDLGVITRRYAAPSFAPDRWLAGQPKGWGEEATQTTLGWGESAPSEEASAELMLDITASPDATLRVARSRVDLRPVYQHGHAESPDGKLRVEILTPRKTWVHVTVNDATNDRPTPVRIHFRAPDGRYLPPYGHRHEVNDNWFEDYGGDLKLGSTQYAYVDGRFQIELPVGEVFVEIAKGFEYQPVRQRVVIEPGQHALELRVQRVYDWRTQGWVTADTHVHFLSPQTAWLEAKGEGINLVNLLASQWGELFTNVADLTGDLSGVSRDDTLIWVGTENRQHILGHMSLLGVKGEPVFPMCASGPDESYFGDPAWMSLAEWADLCREREGLVVIPHFPNPYCEVAADIVLGKIDAAEIRYFTPAMDGYNVREWYRFLNCGYRVAAVGGTDKMWAGMPLGGVRTYANIGNEEFTFASWSKAVRAGRTFTTSGPLIKLAVEGHEAGSEIALPSGGGTMEAEAWVKSVQPFHELQLVVNGQVVAHEVSEGGTMEAHLRAQVPIKASAWIAARCISRLKVWHGWPVHIAAHTSPVYVRCGDAEIFSASDAAYLLTLIEGGLTWLETLSIPASAEQEKRIRKTFEAARASLGQRHRKTHLVPGEGRYARGQM